MKNARPARAQHFDKTNDYSIPSVVRYYDSFLDQYFSIDKPNINNTWQISIDGVLEQFDFLTFPENYIHTLKRWCVWLLHHNSAATTSYYYNGLSNINHIHLDSIFHVTPLNSNLFWRDLTVAGLSTAQLSSTKSLLRFFCDCFTNGWSHDYLDYLSTLPLPFKDKYASVRAGDVFLSVAEEALIVSAIDQAVVQVNNAPKSLGNSELASMAMLICSFQFGMRPKQIGMIRLRDIRIWTENDDAVPAVHLIFKKIKQRSSSKEFPLLRKVKREWTPLFAELYRRAVAEGLIGNDRLFKVNSAYQASQTVANALEQILPKRRTAGNLRHTAAQRLVDAGANKEELAEFMGHSDTDTGLVYFETSPNQAKRVNDALGISSVYRQVVKVAHAKFISSVELVELKGTQQIGAVPHGIPIAGIGGCAVGQPACPSNPVMACYGCGKFMPISDVSIHQSVLTDFRTIVSFFSVQSKGDENSPAYLQLKRTISNVQGVIDELIGSDL